MWGVIVCVGGFGVVEEEDGDGEEDEEEEDWFWRGRGGRANISGGFGEVRFGGLWVDILLWF